MFRRIYMNMVFSSQRKQTILFVITNMAAATSRANQQCNRSLQPTLTFKWGQVHNLSCENEFNLYENEKSFSNQRLSTYPRFDTEARGNSEMAYYVWIWAVQYYRAFSLTWPASLQIYWNKLTISSCVSVREHVGSLQSTKEA